MSAPDSPLPDDLPPPPVAPVEPLEAANEPSPDSWEPPVIDIQLVEPVRPPHPGFWWSVLWCLGYLAITQLPAALIGAMVLVLLLGVGPDGMARLQDPNLAQQPEYAQAMGPAILVAQLLGMLGSWLALRLVIGKGWTRVIARRRLGASHLFLVLLALPGMMVLANGLEVLSRPVFREIFGTEDLFHLNETMRLIGRWPLWLGILAVGIGPALAEEMFCRGFLGRGLVGRYGPVGGVLLTSLFFGLLHLDPRQATFAFVLGLFLHAAYLLTRSLWAPILLHLGNNTMAVLSLHVPALILLDKDLEQAPWQAPAVLAGGALILLLGVGYALVQSRARLAPLHSLPAWEPANPGVEWPPAEWAAALVRPAPSGKAWLFALGGVVAFAGGIVGAVFLFRT